ncbi:hypothetical protein FKM82_023034 [Ascaphus truei]
MHLFTWAPCEWIFQAKVTHCVLICMSFPRIPCWRACQCTSICHLYLCWIPYNHNRLTDHKCRTSKGPQRIWPKKSPVWNYTTWYRSPACSGIGSRISV